MKLGINMLAKDLQFALLSKHHMSLSEACLPLYTAPVAVLHKRVMRQHHPFIAPGGSPEILMVHWPFGLKYKAYKLSCLKLASKIRNPQWYLAPGGSGIEG